MIKPLKKKAKLKSDGNIENQIKKNQKKLDDMNQRIDEDFVGGYQAYAKEKENFDIKALSIGGKLLDAGQIDVLAKLPTHDQALSILMSVMLAPLTKLARTMIEVPSKATRAVAAVRDQKQEAA